MKSTLFAALFVLSATSAFAIDGQILINQATVMAAGGFPFKIDQSGSYKLSGNLVVPDGSNGIAVSVANVTIDLNGFSIQTVTTSITSGITAVPNHNAGGVTVANDVSGITIRNGTIKGFFFAVNPSPLGQSSAVAYSGWTLQDLQLIPGFGGGTTYLGTSTRMISVSALGFDFVVTCPSIVTLTITVAIGTSGTSSQCSLTNNATTSTFQ